MPSAGGHHEVVVRDHVFVELDDLGVEIDRACFGKEHLRVLLRAEDATNRDGDVARIERGRSHLIEERLKQVMIAPIDQGHSHGCVRERPCRIEAAETPAQDHYVRWWVGHSPTS